MCCDAVVSYIAQLVYELSGLSTLHSGTWNTGSLTLKASFIPELKTLQTVDCPVGLDPLAVNTLSPFSEHPLGFSLKNTPTFKIHGNQICSQMFCQLGMNDLYASKENVSVRACFI